jgi:hypothetical protein
MGMRRVQTIMNRRQVEEGKDEDGRKPERFRWWKCVQGVPASVPAPELPVLPTLEPAAGMLAPATARAPGPEVAMAPSGSQSGHMAPTQDSTRHLLQYNQVQENFNKRDNL